MLPYGRTWTPPSDASEFRPDRFGIGRTWLFAGSERGGEQAIAMNTLIGTAKLNDVWLADVLHRLADLPPPLVRRL